MKKGLTWPLARLLALLLTGSLCLSQRLTAQPVPPVGSPRTNAPLVWYPRPSVDNPDDERARERMDFVAADSDSVDDWGTDEKLSPVWTGEEADLPATSSGPAIQLAGSLEADNPMKGVRPSNRDAAPRPDPAFRTAPGEEPNDPGLTDADDHPNPTKAPLEFSTSGHPGLWTVNGHPTAYFGPPSFADFAAGSGNPPKQTPPLPDPSWWVPLTPGENADDLRSSDEADVGHLPSAWPPSWRQPMVMEPIIPEPQLRWLLFAGGVGLLATRRRQR